MPAEPTVDPPDLEKVPDFDAVKGFITDNVSLAEAAKVLKWIGKLELWCNAAAERFEADADKLDDTIKDYEDREEAASTEASYWKDRSVWVDTFVEMVEDIVRGVKDGDDLLWLMEDVPEYEEYVPQEKPQDAKPK